MTEVSPGVITCASPYRTAWWSFGRAWGIASAKAGLLLKCWRIEQHQWDIWCILENMGNIGKYGKYWKYTMGKGIHNMGNTGMIINRVSDIISNMLFRCLKRARKPLQTRRTLKGSSFPNLSRYAKMFQTAWDVLLKQATSKVLRSIILVLRLLELAGQQFLYRSSNYI